MNTENKEKVLLTKSLCLPCQKTKCSPKLPGPQQASLKSLANSFVSLKKTKKYRCVLTTMPTWTSRWLRWWHLEVRSSRPPLVTSGHAWISNSWVVKDYFKFSNVESWSQTWRRWHLLATRASPLSVNLEQPEREIAFTVEERATPLRLTLKRLRCYSGSAAPCSSPSSPSVSSLSSWWRRGPPRCGLPGRR